MSDNEQTKDVAIFTEFPEGEEESVEFLNDLQKCLNPDIDLPQSVIYSVNSLQGVWCNSHNLMVNNQNLPIEFKDDLNLLKSVSFEILKDLNSDDSKYFKNLGVLVAKTNKLCNNYKYIVTQIKKYENSKDD